MKQQQLILDTTLDYNPETGLSTPEFGHIHYEINEGNE